MKITKILVLLATCLAVSTPTIAAGTLPTVSYLKNTEKNTDAGGGDIYFNDSFDCQLRPDNKSEPLNGASILMRLYHKREATGRYRFNIDGKDIELKPSTFMLISDKGKVLTYEQGNKLKEADRAKYTTLVVFQHQGIKITLDYGKEADNEGGDSWLLPSSKLILENQNTRQEILLTCVGFGG